MCFYYLNYRGGGGGGGMGEWCGDDKQLQKEVAATNFQLMKRRRVNDDEQVEQGTTTTTIAASQVQHKEEVAATPKGKRYRIPQLGSCPPNINNKRRRRLAVAVADKPSSHLLFFTSPDIDLFFSSAFNHISHSSF